jgi:ABC-2 type transport system ATP-binding protein
VTEIGSTARTTPEPALQVRGVSVTLGGIGILDDVSFEVATGSATGLVGPNGAGKSTLMRVILGLQRPDQGETLVCGRPLPAHKCPLQVLGVLSDAARPDPRMTPRSFLRYLCAWSGIRPSRVDEVLARTSAAGYSGKQIGSLSTGMRQRVMLAAALLGDPGFLLLDEPHNGLDPDGVRWLRSFLRDFVSQGRSVLVASHLLAEIGSSTDQVVILNQRVRFVGPVPDLNAAEGIEDTFAALAGGGAP